MASVAENLFIPSVNTAHDGLSIYQRRDYLNCLSRVDSGRPRHLVKRDSDVTSAIFFLKTVFIGSPVMF